MKTLAVFIFASLIQACSVFTTPGPEPEIPPTTSPMANAMDSTVALVDMLGDSYCAGTFVNDLVITAAHCVEPVELVNVGIIDDYSYDDSVFHQFYDFRVIFHDPDTDLAILAPDMLTPRHTSVKLSPEAPVMFDKVVVIGHPAYTEYTVTQGMVVHPNRDSITGSWMQFNAPIAPGNSGGPVFNRYGELIGVVSFMKCTRLGCHPHLGGAVPYSVLLEHLEIE